MAKKKVIEGDENSCLYLAHTPKELKPYEDELKVLGKLHDFFIKKSEHLFEGKTIVVQTVIKIKSKE